MRLRRWARGLEAATSAPRLARRCHAAPRPRQAQLLASSSRVLLPRAPLQPTAAPRPLSALSRRPQAASLGRCLIPLAQPSLPRPLSRPLPRPLSSVAQDEATPAPVDHLSGQAAALKVTWWGAGVNIGLAGLKYAAGILSGSSALVADAAHSLSDLLSDIITLFVVEAARRPPDKDHPYGHGRLETLGSLSVASVLVATAGGLGWNAFSEICHWWTTGTIEGGLATSGYGTFAVIACLISLLAKESLYHVTARIGREIGSPTLMANAWHHRSDAFSSVAALVGVAGSLAGAPLLDPIAGLAVSGLVAKAGIDIGWEAVEEVTEKTRPDDETHVAVQDAAAGISGVVSIDKLRVRRMGPYFLVDVRVEVDPKISVSAARNVAEHCRRAVFAAHHNVSDVIVHVTPFKQPPVLPGGSGSLMRTHKEVEKEVRTAVAAMPDVLGASNIIVHYVPESGICIKVDIICSEELTICRAREIATATKGTLEEIPDVFAVEIDLELGVETPGFFH